MSEPLDFVIGPGAIVGEYQIEAEIGRGGMGTVFSAIHPLIGKRAAIKVLNGQLCGDPLAVERFINEARVVNQIAHPNIIDVFAFGEMLDGRRYLVMEWLSGETLRARIERGSVSLVEACDLLKPLVRALAAAHANDVIHRDLKPENVFLIDVPGERPAVKLLDFGIAKLLRNDRIGERTVTGAIVGTPQYIAPEQARGQSIDHRVDIYALGALAFELLTRRPPFAAETAMEVVALHLLEPAPKPSEHVDVPRELDDLVWTMLAKDPADRPTLDAVCAVLDVVRDRPAHMPGPEPRPSRRERAESHAVTTERAAVAASLRLAAQRVVRPWFALVGLVAALLAVSYAMNASRDDPEQPPAQPRSTAEPTLDEPAQVQPITAPVARAPKTNAGEAPTVDSHPRKPNRQPTARPRATATVPHASRPEPVDASSDDDKGLLPPHRGMAPAK